jgi:ribosome-associated protein
MQKKQITVTNYPIRLGQFLKLAAIVQDGFEAKILIQSGKIAINGHIEKRRGRQLEINDTVQLERGTIYVLT